VKDRLPSRARNDLLARSAALSARLIDFYFKFCPARSLFRNVRAIIAILRTAIYIHRRIRATVNKNVRRESPRESNEIFQLETPNFSPLILRHVFV